MTTTPAVGTAATDTRVLRKVSPLPEPPQPKGKRTAVRTRDLQADEPGHYVTKGRRLRGPGDDEDEEQDLHRKRRARSQPKYGDTSD